MWPRPKGATLERKNNNRGYSPSNCVWADRTAQANNRKSNRRITYNGHTASIAEWSRITGISQSALRKRLEMGWSIGDVIENPVRSCSRRRKYTYKGQTKTLEQWSSIYGIKPTTIRERITRGWSMHRALHKAA